MEKIKVLVVPSDTIGGVGFYRSIQPHVQLQEQFGSDFDVTISPDFNWANLEEVKKYNIINFHKGIYQDMVSFRKALAFCKENGIITIMDIDDNWDLHSKHPLYTSQKHYKMDVITRENLTLVDYVTTTTPIFANKIKKFNKNVIVFPNAINPEDKRFQINKEKSDKLRIGLIMGSSHEEDMKLLDGVVNKLPADIKKKITFVLCGFDLRGTVRSINPQTGEITTRNIEPLETVWYRYEKCLTDNYRICSPDYTKFLHMFIPDAQYPLVANENYKRCWTKDINNYYQHYKEIDILLVPLVDNDFNNCKSQLKVIEAAFSNTAVIASNTGPYTIDLVNAIEKGGTINENGNALLVDINKNHKDWAKYITKCVNDPQLVEMLKKNLQKDICVKYDLRNITNTRAEFYKNILIK